MQHRKLGSSDLNVSLLGLGGNNFVVRLDLDATRKVVDAAIDLGVTLIDTADIYGDFGGSEDCLGQVLGTRRNKVVGIIVPPPREKAEKEAPQPDFYTRLEELFHDTTRPVTGTELVSWARGER